MITENNLVNVLLHFGFTQEDNVFRKEYQQGASIEVNTKTQKISYLPLDKDFSSGEYPSKDKPAKGFVIHRDTTLNFNANENFVCLVCVHLLLEKGYEPKHLVFEPAFKVGHINKPSYGDILVFDKEYHPLVLIENKTFGSEFSVEWNNMQKDGGQLFSYLGPLVNELGFCENLVLFAADFDEKEIIKSHIITLKDNEKRIKELENPKTFGNAQGKYFEVWSETYAKSFETKGLFEQDIESYSIGKLKYTTKDLKSLSHSEIKPIYNEFATILRNHAITDFEHSFYILIDLVLCKITDELNNPDDLQFYYKGITRDTPKEYCARLLDLYQLGKKQLFNVDVVNRDEKDILQIFEDTKRSVTNGLYAGIKELFEEIKFYNIKKFNFIEVENKEEFEMNFQILIKIAALLQDINLSNSETTHFFGDLFECLLSKNVHQTEGQFFTPLPIVNFIIKSLPEFPNSNLIKVLDYACGAGHFLTEFVKAYPKTKAFGIEKSQPLSQVAKIATIINGAKESHIVFKDSLSILNTLEIRFQGFDRETFDCIIANPPYSVKGFLNTLTENDRNQFDLTRFVKEESYGKNDAIECFFVERAKHFLKPNGIMGIILPSSILTNGSICKNVRELLFEHFNILAIVNLGSRTFSSTGTSTIILFAQKVRKNSEGLLHTFINKQDYTQYLNYSAIDSYIDKQGYNKDEYFTFMQDETLAVGLANHEIFVEYKKIFNPKKINKTTQKEWFKDSSFFKEDLRTNSREYKIQLSQYLDSDEYITREKKDFDEQFVLFAKEIEKDKLNTFIQIEKNDVAILQSPPDKVDSKSNKEQIVKFLGYDWSTRKGDEGIKYITSHAAVEANDAEDDTDSGVVNTINSIRYIETPLYSPDDDYDCTKFAFALRKHIVAQCNKFSFTQKLSDNLNRDFSGEMEGLLSYANLANMVDFSRDSFNKTISLTPDKKIIIKSKFPLEKLGNIAEIEKGNTITKAEAVPGNIKVVAGGTDYAYMHNKSNRKANIITISASGANAGYVNYWKEPIYASDCTTVKCDDDLRTLYIFNVLQSIQNQLYYLQKGSGQPHVYPNDIAEIPIPQIEPDLMKKIVDECEEIDNEFQSSRMTIEVYRRKINDAFEKLDIIQGGGKRLKMSNISHFEVSIGKRVLTSEMNPEFKIPVYSANVFESFGMIDHLLLTDFSKDSVIWGMDGDWMVNTIPANTPFYPTDHCGVIRIKTNNILPKYLAFVLQREGQRVGFNRSFRASIDRIEGLTVNIAPIEKQKEFVKQVEEYEKIINQAQNVLDNCITRKKEIVAKYLLEET